MAVENIIVWVSVVLAGVYMVRRTWRAFTRPSCGCGSSGCPSQKPRTAASLQPLVQLSLPAPSDPGKEKGVAQINKQVRV